MRRATGIIAFSVILLAAGLVSAKTLLLEGRLDSTIAMRQQMEFAVDRGTVQTFTFTFALPADFKSTSVSQAISGQALNITPRPSSSTVEKDRFGNRFQKAVWKNLDSDVRISLTYTADVRSELSAMESRTPFPIGTVSGAEALYLKSTEMVQSDAPGIRDLARQLTAGAATEYEAVTAVTNHVADLVKYTFNPPKYDALYTLETKSGNCQNFAHLNIALLRSLGIPARIVGGITLKDSWKVPIDSRSSIVQSMGQGGHAWIEIYFPDLGWLPYDPQQSRQFTSSRHIKQTHGLDSRDINDTWRGAPYLPRYSEMIEGSFTADEIKLAVKSTRDDPRPYIISNLVAARAVEAGQGEVPQAVDPSVAAAAAERERIARETTERERLEQERLRTERLKAEQLARQKADEERRAKERSAKERIARERAEAERVARAKADEERANFERAEKERLAREKAEAERAAGERAEAERAARAKAEAERRVRERAEAERVARLTAAAEAERLKALKSRKPSPGTKLVFGNMEFPNLVDSFSIKGDTGTRILDKETSEYVTSRYIYAQAFVVRDAMKLDQVSLAMRRFGGDGSVYVDVVRDDGGRPGLPGQVEGIRSNFIDLEKITRKPGYYWVDFPLPERFSMKPGKYWIILRNSGEAIMNWFYIPGKPYGEGDDTRSTARGFQWEDILNYDFVFKVSGIAL